MRLLIGTLKYVIQQVVLAKNEFINHDGQYFRNFRYIQALKTPVQVLKKRCWLNSEEFLWEESC